ncbi:MAG: hypothetical protein ABII27_08130 [bacterium]
MCEETFNVCDFVNEIIMMSTNLDLRNDIKEVVREELHCNVIYSDGVIAKIPRKYIDDRNKNYIAKHCLLKRK